MQVMDEQKRLKILKAAARLFATQPFHKVLLSDVAEEAAVGKGTLYIYFKNKEDLFLSVLCNGISRLSAHLQERMDEETNTPMGNLEMIVREIVGFAYEKPHLFEVIRMIPNWDSANRAEWESRRKDFRYLIETVIRKGMEQGYFEDTHPQLTAKYIPGLVRSALLDGIDTIDREVLTDHILGFIKKAIIVKEAPCRKNG